MRKLAVFYEFCKSFEGRRTSIQQGFSQPAKLNGHLRERIILSLAAIAGK